VPTAPPRRTDLDGLRGLAIALVVVYHVWFGRVSGGVDVFLVLSGYFFGSRLLRRPDGLPPARLPAELLRLVRRLVPALVVVLAAAAVLTAAIQPQTRWEAFADQTLASLGYYQNWLLATTVGDYSRAGEAVSPLQHIWSMSVQGQFFVALLLIAVLVGLIAGRHHRTALVDVVAVAFVASFWYALVTHGADPARAYYDSFARAWEPLAGVLAAAVVGLIRWPAWLRVTAATVGLVAILGCGAVLDGATQFPGPWALVPVVATVLIIFSGANTATGWRVLGVRPLVTLGAMAYALYLWHWPLLIFWLAATDRDAAGLLDGAAVMLVAAVLAYLTLRLVENPLRYRARPAPQQPAPDRASRGRARARVALAGAVALTAVALTAASLSWLGHVEDVRAKGAELQSLPTRDYPGGRALIEQVRVAELPMRPTVFEAREDIPVTTTDGCITVFTSSELIRCVYGSPGASRTIALAGGSHAEHWITALDELGREYDFRVVTYLKMGCPLNTEAEPRIAGSLKPYPECAQWVRTTMDALIADRPDYVFTTTTRPRVDGPGDMVPESYLGIWDELQAHGIAILGMRDTPWMYRDGFLFTPRDCLADGGDAESCGLPRAEALADHNPTLDYADAYPLLTILDLSDAVCRPDFCRAVEGNVLVYHDSHHLSATYVRTLIDELGRQLRTATGWW